MAARNFAVFVRGVARAAEAASRSRRSGGRAWRRRSEPRWRAAMTADARDAARRAGRILEHAARGRLLPRGPGAGLRRLALDRLLDRVGRRLDASPAPGHRDIAAALREAVRAGDYRGAARLVTTAARRADTRAEKVLSRRYRFLWICNPKAASRSMIAALRAADPAAELIRGRTLDEVLERRPEARAYFRFAFLRHPVDRTRSCWADKHALALTDRRAHRWFIRPYHGLEAGMGFDEFCRWLATPFGSDAFADRHWLSQHRQLRSADGRLPDFLGRFERLDADWRAVCARVGLPCRALPRLNPGPHGARAAGPEAASAALLRLRYAEDFRIGGYHGTHEHALADEADRAAAARRCG